MVAVVLTRDTYSALATSVLVVHALFVRGGSLQTLRFGRWRERFSTA